MMLSKYVHGLDKLLEHFSENELKKISLKEFRFAFEEKKTYSNGLYLTVNKSIWFENKKDPKKRFFITISIIKGLSEIDYKNEPARTEIIINILGNYAETSFDGWETIAILHKKTSGIMPVIKKVEEQIQKMKTALQKDERIRLRHILSDNPPVKFENKLTKTIKEIEKEVRIIIKLSKKRKIELDPIYYTDHFEYFETSKSRAVGEIPDVIHAKLKNGKVKEIKKDSIISVGFK